MCLTMFELLIKLLNFKRGLCRVEAPQHKCIIMHIPEKILNRKRVESLVYVLLFKNKYSYKNINLELLALYRTIEE